MAGSQTECATVAAHVHEEDVVSPDDAGRRDGSVETAAGDVGQDAAAPWLDTPESVIRDYLQAAMLRNEKEGWQRAKSLLHSEMTGQMGFRPTAWKFARLKWDLYVWKGGQPCRRVRTCDEHTPARFAVDWMEALPPDKVTVFIRCFANPDEPKPCTVRTDAAANDAWRLWDCWL